MRTTLAILCITGICAVASCDSKPDDGPGATDGGAVDEASGANDAGGIDGAIGDAAADGPLDGSTPAFTHRDINHVLGTGQSLSVGAQGFPFITTTQPYANITFVTGVMSGGTGLTSFVPLVEGDTNGAQQVETLSSSFANLVTKLAREEVFVGGPPGKNGHDLLVSAHGIGGTPYSGLKKGTVAFTNGMAQVTAGKDLAGKAGKSYVVRAVTNVHGESDHVAGNASYQANLLEWQSDYETGVKAITGQTESVPMLQTQVSSWTKYGQATSIIPAQQLGAHVAAPGKMILVGPKYHLEYTADGVHLTAKGYQHMGEDYAKVYRRVVLEGQPWEPVRPKKITRAGAQITIEMHVPKPPLAMDTTIVSDPGKNGFEYTDDSGAAPAIASVAITGPTTVVVTLAAAPTGANKRVRYAFTGTAGALGGPTTGPRGNLRDSDATPSRDGYPLYNWCIHFDEAVP